MPHTPESISDAAQNYLTEAYASVNYPAYPPLDDTAAWESMIAQGDADLIARFSGIELPVTTELLEFDGVPVYRIVPEGADESGPIFLDIHGGALIVGGGEACQKMGEAIALTRGMVTWAVDYRMPPSHPYPAGLDDCVVAYRALLAQREPSEVFVGGASAGGNLAAALIVRIKEEGLAMPAGLVLLTPEVDLTQSGDSFTTLRGLDVLLDDLMAPNLLYAGGADLKDPHLSPLFADHAGFPPTFIQCGTRDLFLSNAVRMHRSLRAAGVPAELHLWEAMPHGGFGGMSPEDFEVGAEVRAFLDRLRP